MLLGFGRVDINGNTSHTKVNAPAVGAYFASRLSGDIILDGFVGYARPKYEADGAVFKSDRVSLALSLTGQYAATNGTMRLFARVSGYNEDQPAYTGTISTVAANKIEAYKASLGARFEASKAIGSTGMLPYVSAAVDYGYSKSTNNGTEDFVAPRLGVGLSGAVGAGYLSLDMDGGKVSSDTYDVGLRATYEFTF